MVQIEALPRTVELTKNEEGRVVFTYVDQRKLSDELVFCETHDWHEVIYAIKTLAVRGAPAIGAAGAAAVALWAADHHSKVGDFAQDLDSIEKARPTAVNLSWAVKRMRDSLSILLSASSLEPEQPIPSYVSDAAFDLAKSIEIEDETTNRQLGANGADLLPDHARVLTYCNAGSLATVFFGTALGVIYTAAERGKIDHVYSCETRPVGQGARLTVWELSKAGVPVTLICDNMAASLMASGAVDAVVVGADRITANGDVANKIGTYGLAILAQHHGIPFYVAAPHSTIDMSKKDGSEIVIEQRESWEVHPNPPMGVEIWNPAFDVTPADLITAVITETGVYHWPFDL